VVILLLVINTQPEAYIIYILGYIIDIIDDRARDRPSHGDLHW